MDLMKVLRLEDAGGLQVLGRIVKAGGKPRPVRVKLGIGRTGVQFFSKLKC